MQPAPRARQYLLSSLFLMVAGWGGLILLIFALGVPPLVWARWGFFALWFIALSGTALPVAYFLNLRFPSDPPADPQTIVRQSLWVGVYGCLVAWLQLGHVMAFWMWIGLALGLAVVEYLIRLRERARWRPPLQTAETDDLSGVRGAADTSSWLEGDESSE